MSDQLATLNSSDVEIDLLSPEGEHSLFRMLNGSRATQEAIKEIPAELFERTERELLKAPDEIQNRLKISFWNEYRRCQRQKKNIVLSNILFGVCSSSYWQKQVLAQKDVLAWLITPPTSELLVWQELLELGNKKLRRALKLPLVEKRYWRDKTGEVHIEKRANVSLIKEIRSIVEMLQNRLHGSVVQRAELKSLNVNVDANGGEKSGPQQMQEIKQLLGKLENLVGNESPVPEPILEGEIADDPEMATEGQG